jgi:hypothetical protein
LEPVASIAAGDWHTVASLTNGTVRCWGYNETYQCDTPSNIGAAIAVTAGSAHTVALRADRTVRCWGWNGYGQCNVPAGIGAVASISARGEHTVALLQDGSVRIWGRNDYGQCNVPSNIGTTARVSAGAVHTVVLSGVPPVDADGDGQADSFDNCPNVYNPNQADCDNNGIGDACQNGFDDVNLNSIPDYCECIADIVLADRQVNGADLGALLSQWGPANAATVSDVNRDGQVNGADLGYLLSNWGPCSN